MNKLLVTGLSGQLGKSIQSRVDHAIWKVLITGRDVLDITNAEQMSDVFSLFQPHVVINTASYTNVDQAELEPEVAYGVNAHGPLLLAKHCKEYEAVLIHISTDYVFDGKSNRDYLEDDPASPLNVYGRTKWEGDLNIQAVLKTYFIIRTAWVFSEYGENFVSGLVKLSGKRARICVVDDQVGCPTYAGDIAELVLKIASDCLSGQGRYEYGIYNYCGDEVVSWYEFACAIFEELDKYNKQEVDQQINRISSEEYASLAERPKCAILNCSKILHLANPSDWRSALYQVFKNLDDLNAYKVIQ